MLETKPSQSLAVVTAFKEELPHAAIYVYDNNSTDGTADEARRNGAIVRHEPQQGKGHVVRRMFADVEADVYLLVDGDGTYCAEDAPAMVEALLNQRLDMVVANRSTAEIDSYRFGHQTGNRIFTSIVGWIFGRRRQRHPLRVSCLFSAIREVVSSALDRLRD